MVVYLYVWLCMYVRVCDVCVYVCVMHVYVCICMCVIVIVYVDGHVYVHEYVGEVHACEKHVCLIRAR